MKFGRYFIDRPRFAAVISILIVLLGVLGFFTLPVTQYPEIAPPTIIVRAGYPGASPEVIVDSVATPIEEEVNGVDGMLYMTSQATADGQLQLTITFELGTDLDNAQVLVQNRVGVAEPRLPEEVRRLGVTTLKSSPDLMMVVSMESPDGTYDPLYISNYALMNVRDVLARIDGVGSIIVFGAREYSMRIWLDPEKLAALDLTAGDVVAAMRAQNVQVTGGTLGQPPVPSPIAFQMSVNTQGRFMEAEQFRDVIIKSGADGRLTRVRDVARVELGARDYQTSNYLDGRPAIAIAVFQRPGSNALETAEEIKSTMDELARNFPTGLTYRIVFNPNEFIQESVRAVYTAMLESCLLVILVIILFLQSWRAAIIPVIAIPVSLIGTCAVMSLFGVSLNNLSLFGLALAIGIVVDDAIVVVENIDRNLAQGMAPKDAARVTMDEVGTALVSIALVLSAVFIPSAFLGGITGQFFRQFALTIAVATIISALNSLTLSPALGGILLRARPATSTGPGRSGQSVVNPVFRTFNRAFARMRDSYGRLICRVVHHPVAAFAVFLILIGLGAFMLQRVPAGFIPHQDQGVLIVAGELPKGASIERTREVMLHASEVILGTPGAAHAIMVVGFSGASFSTAPNAGTLFVRLDPFADRGPEQSSQAMVQRLVQTLSRIQEAQFFVIDPPPVRGLGRGGGFKMLVEDRGGRGIATLEKATGDLVVAANATSRVQGVFSTFSTATPRYFLDIDRTKAEMLDVPVENVFDALQVNLGSAYVNDFNLLGRSFRVTAQADAPFRIEPRNIERLHARSAKGAMVPLGSFVELRTTSGPERLVRHNLYPATEVQGRAAPGTSSGEAIRIMERLADRVLPRGLSHEWTEIAFQERQAGNVGLLVFPLSVLFVFLLLTAQYESWSLPLAIILIVPLCILFALTGVWLRGMDNNILTQIGFIVLIGLACKNSVLIVEFARQYEEQGRDRFKAATDAAQVRLRPILMTSFAFIFGVLPMMLATGPGAEMRQVLGTTVFSGMLGVTLAGLFLTPVFYIVIRSFVARAHAPAEVGA